MPPSTSTFPSWDFGKPKAGAETPPPLPIPTPSEEHNPELGKAPVESTGAEAPSVILGTGRTLQSATSGKISPELWWKTLMATVAEKKVTDIIFNPEDHSAFARTNTELDRYQQIGKADYDNLIKFQVPPEKLPELELKGESDFAVTCFGRRMRVNVFKTLKGFAAAFRPLPNKSIPWRDNGLTEPMMKVIETTKQGLVLVTGPTGSGKCLGKGTPVKKYSGEIVPVETIRAGDLLMGPDLKPRAVLSTNQGEGPLYQITPNRGKPWVCNDAHIMTLLAAGPTEIPDAWLHPFQTQAITDIPLDKFLKWDAPGKENLHLFAVNPTTGEITTTAWKSEPIGIGTFYGFTLDQDGRFLLGDNTVTHNSTTICSMLEYINEKYPYHIISIEDPIEYIFTNKRSVISQREVGEHTDSFQSALRASLRENPDIIFVGEMRDYETAKTALMAADTGHLVFGTLHTRRVYTTISRLLEMAPESSRPEMRAMLSNALAMVICQRLLQKRGGGIWPCREVMMLNPAISSLIKEGKEKGISNQLTINLNKGMMEWGKALDIAEKSALITAEEAERFRDSTEEVD